jgi:hypothetical protein
VDTQSAVINCSVDASSRVYTTKTPYPPRQTQASYEPPPSGFSPVYTELVARHGSRGLSSVKLYNLYVVAPAMPKSSCLLWDVYRDPSGTPLVKMLCNERETDFRPTCDSAHYATGSHYYRYEKLKACYGHTP